jgi:hypothetical protein
MTQYVFPNLVSPTSGPLLRATLTNWYNAEISGNSGNIAPTSPVLGSKWMDTSAYPIIRLKIYDGAQWATISSIDASTHTALAGGLNQFDETDILLGGFIYYDADLKRHRYWTHGHKWAASGKTEAINQPGYTLIHDSKLYDIFRPVTRYRSTYNGTVTGLIWNLPYPTPQYSWSSCSFDGKIWIIGGADGSGTDYDTVYYSANGQDWALATDAPGWAARRSPVILVFDSKIWIIGGSSWSGSTLTFNTDVWHSSDGVNWTKTADSVAYNFKTTNHGHVYDGKMWVLGDNGAIYYSANGATWTLGATLSKTYQYNLDYREVWGFALHDGWIYLAAGDRCWRTKNMVDWTACQPGADLANKCKIQSFDGQLLLRGGTKILKGR